MIAGISYKIFDAYVKGMIEVGRKVREHNPNVLLYPVRGAVPVADVLSIIDPSINTIPHEYVPASSTIVDTNRVIHSWFKKFLEESHVIGDRQSILSIDEVLSGHSVYRVSNQVRRAVADYAHERGVSLERIMGEVDYKSIGIEDTRHRAAGKPMQKHYGRLVGQGIVIPVQVPENVTMDKDDFCPLKLVRIPGHRFGSHLPIMEEFRVTTRYLDFLKAIATAVGRDITTVQLQSPADIQHSERYLPAEYQSVEAYINSQQQKF